MSLATRCTACGTVFRVVQDQLKVSEGWVRCGRCNEVFSALEGLFDMERESAPEWAPNRADLQDALGLPDSPLDLPDSPLDLPGSPSRNDDEPTVSVAADEADADPQWSSAEATANESREPGTLAGAAPQRDPERPAELATLLHRAADADPDIDADIVIDADAAEPDAGTEDAAPSGTGSAFVAPAFVRHAQRRAMWRSPRVRAALLVAAVVLLLTLGLQGMHHFRDAIAASSPSWRPVLANWCGALSCSIEPARRIDAVTVESSALTRAPVADAFNLSVVLRNRGTTAIALPAVDLNLTDANGQLVARKVLLPQDFKVSPGPMGPGADAVLQLALAVDGAQVSGYTVEIFYP